MIIRNAEFICDLLTNNISKSKAFKTIDCSKWKNSKSGTGFGSILDCYNRRNNSDSMKSVYFFLKKFELFYVN